MSELSPLDDRLITEINDIQTQNFTQSVNSNVPTMPDWIERNPSDYEVDTSNEVRTTIQEAELVEIGTFIRYELPGLNTFFYDQIHFIEEVTVNTFDFRVLNGFQGFPSTTDFQSFDIYTGQSPLVEADYLEAFDIGEAELTTDGIINVTSLTVQGHMVGSLLHVTMNAQFDLSGGSYVELEGIPGISTFYPFAYEYNNSSSNSLHFATQNGDKVRFTEGLNNSNGQRIITSFYYVVKGYTPGFTIS